MVGGLCSETNLDTHFLKEESEDLSTSVLSSGFLVVHDTIGGSEDELSKLTRREQIGSELLDLINGDIKSWRNDTALVQTSKKIEDNLAGSMVVDNLKLSNVSVLLHDLEELDNYLRTGTDENL